jgi:transcriptional regulator with GAF, ATPase, and Fis domain
MSLSAQAKCFGVTRTKNITRVEAKKITVDVRVLAATNKI